MKYLVGQDSEREVQIQKEDHNARLVANGLREEELR
jgi:hypothetical protein